jgi:hypothetical protein
MYNILIFHIGGGGHFWTRGTNGQGFFHVKHIIKKLKITNTWFYDCLIHTEISDMCTRWQKKGWWQRENFIQILSSSPAVNLSGNKWVFCTFFFEFFYCFLKVLRVFKGLLRVFCGFFEGLLRVLGDFIEDFLWFLKGVLRWRCYLAESSSNFFWNLAVMYRNLALSTALRVFNTGIYFQNWFFGIQKLRNRDPGFKTGFEIFD